MLTLTLNQAKVFVNSSEVPAPRLFWQPCSKTNEKARLLCLVDGKVARKEVSWLLHPLYKKGDDDKTCAAVNALFLPAVEAHRGATPELLFRHGDSELHAFEDLFVDFGEGKIHPKPAHVLVQRTGRTATFDAVLFWGLEFFEATHIERKFLIPFLRHIQNLQCPILDTGTDPLGVSMIRDALLDLPLAEVVELINGGASDSDESEYIPSDEDIEYEREKPSLKRKR